MINYLMKIYTVNRITLKELSVKLSHFSFYVI